jgi:hypothetical protein
MRSVSCFRGFRGTAGYLIRVRRVPGDTTIQGSPVRHAARVPCDHVLSCSGLPVIGRFTGACYFLFGIGNVLSLSLGLHHFNFPVGL